MSTGLLDVRRLAERLDVKVSTVRAYRSRGLLPEPDEWFGRSPVWTPGAIEAWIAARPGQGVGGGGKRTPRTT